MIRAFIKRIYHITLRKKTDGSALLMDNSIFCKIGKNSIFNSKYQLEIRKPAADKLFLEVGEDSVIDGRFIFEKDTGVISVGSRVFIGGGTTFICIDGIEIQDDVMFSWGCTIADNNAHSLISEQRSNDVSDWKKGIDEGKPGAYKDWSVVKSAPILIKRKAWVGFNTIILKGVTVGEGAVIAPAA
jgi:acetyltransferase-like isoleucine patch superfamily enzyme